MPRVNNELTRARTLSGVPDSVKDSFAAAAEKRRLVDVAYATMDSPFGELVIAGTKAGLVHIAYPGDTDPLETIARTVSPRLLAGPHRLDRALRELDRYFEGGLKRFSVPVDWRFARGFAGRILKATARVPYGHVTTYRDVARKAGNPKASRAAGNALGSNPIPIVVPCHRVLRTGGALGGYRGGLNRKLFLLELEGVETGR